MILCETKKYHNTTSQYAIENTLKFLGENLSTDIVLLHFGKRRLD
jgi:hypothetical protein